MKAMLVSATALVLLTCGNAALGAEKNLEFQLVIKNLDQRREEVPFVEGQTITQSKAFGVAVFKDGRIGTKDYVAVSDANKAGGTGFGYSTYYFDDGTVNARFTFTAGAKGFHGDYTIVSGTGAYAGATGTGTFDSIKNPFKNAGLLQVKLQIKTP